MLDKDGKKCLLIYDGDQEVLYDVDDFHRKYSLGEMVDKYINERYWYLPDITRRNVYLLHGLSVAYTCGSTVFFEPIIPNKAYLKQLEKCKKRFKTAISLNMNDRFMNVNIIDSNDNLSPLTDKPYENE